jgi:hypothetical protein
MIALAGSEVAKPRDHAAERLRAAGLAGGCYPFSENDPRLLQLAHRDHGVCEALQRPRQCTYVRDLAEAADTFDVQIAHDSGFSRGMSERMKRVPLAALVAQCAIQRDARCGVVSPCRTVALPHRQARHSKSRLCYCRRRDGNLSRFRCAEEATQHVAPIAQVITVKEEPPQGSGQRKSDLQLVSVESPLDGRAQVCVVLFQQIQACCLTGSEIIDLGVLGEIAKVQRVCSAYVHIQRVLLQVLERVLAQGFQHPEARLAINACVLIEEALFEQ